MRIQTLVVTLAGLALVGTPLFAVTALVPGRYIANLMPEVNEENAKKIEKQLRQIQDIEAVEVVPKDSTLHFTVKEKPLFNVDLNRIANSIKMVVPTTAVSHPVPESRSGTTLPPLSGL